jgi:hypothetical protein
MSHSLVLHLSPLESGALTRLSLRGLLARPLPPWALHRLLRTLARESGEPVHVVLRVDAQGSPWSEAWGDCLAALPTRYFEVRFELEEGRAHRLPEVRR